MIKILSTTFLILTTLLVNGQTIYSKTFGNRKDKPMIFLHGGPGYNSVNFEATTAQRLADQGFFVIIYDRRGEGRSIDEKASFTFKETFEDLNAIYEKYQLKNATLIGHSFGGIVATLYAETYTKKVKTLILVGAPVSLQETFNNIIMKSKIIYHSKNDSVNLKYITMLENMNKKSIEYSSYCFGHAIQNGFYTPKNMTSEAKEIYSRFKSDPLLLEYASKMTYEAPQGFWKNEKYTTIDLTPNLKSLLNQKVNIYGIYGKDDGLYSVEQVTNLQNLLGKENLKYLDNCSHNVFIDQQTQFLQEVKTFTK